MEKCILKIVDQVNVHILGIDAVTKKKLQNLLKFPDPKARHTMAFKLGRWDGKVPFSFGVPGGMGTYLNLLERILPTLMDFYEVDLVDERPTYNFEFPEITEDIVAHKCWPEGHFNAGQPIKLRDYQVRVIKDYLDNISGSIGEVATGSGKTIITAVISHLMEPYGRTITIVPSKDLVEQTKKDFELLDLDVGIFYGDEKEYDKTHTIATWQSLSVYRKREKKEASKAKNPRPVKPDEVPIVPIETFLEDVICIQIDEAHTIVGKELKELLCGPMSHVPIRFAMTGTIPKEDYQFAAILSSIGNVVGEVKASELQEKGVLANCHISILQTQDKHVEFEDYPEELKFLSENRDRLAWIAQHCVKLGENGSTLILVQHIETGNILQSLIPDSVFVSGRVKTKDRKKEYDEVATNDHKIIVATFGVASTGLNIPSLANVVMVDGGKSFTKIIQSIGRGLRIAKGKDFVDITDVTSSLKFSHRHCNARKKYYKAAEYPFTTVKVDYV